MVGNTGGTERDETREYLSPQENEESRLLLYAREQWGWGWWVGELDGEADFSVSKMFRVIQKSRDDLFSQRFPSIWSQVVDIFKPVKPFLMALSVGKKGQ